jgi:hypothetical protein
MMSCCSQLKSELDAYRPTRRSTVRQIELKSTWPAFTPSKIIVVAPPMIFGAKMAKTVPRMARTNTSVSAARRGLR